MSLHADGMVAFEHISLCLAWTTQPASLFVLFLFLETEVFPQVHVALDIFYQHIVHVCRGVDRVVYNHPLCICDVHLKTHSPTFIG